MAHVHACKLLNCVKEESLLGLLDRAVDTDDHCVVPLIRLQSDLLLRLQLLCLHLLDLACKHFLWLRCGVNAVCLCVCVRVCVCVCVCVREREYKRGKVGWCGLQLVHQRSTKGNSRSASHKRQQSLQELTRFHRTIYVNSTIQAVVQAITQLLAAQTHGEPSCLSQCLFMRGVCC